MKKKLLFHIDSFLVGGIEKVLIELLKNIDRDKYEGTLSIGYNLGELELLKDKIPSDIKVEYLLSDDIHCKYKKKKAEGKLNGIEKIMFEALSFFRKQKMKKRLLELVEKNDTIIDFDLTLASFAKNINKRKIVFFHFSPLNYNRGIKKRQERLGRRLANYDKIVLTSNEMVKEAKELYPNLQDKFCRIYNSFDIQERLEMANIYNDDDEKYLRESYILAMARIEETQKDFTTLIKAFALIANEIEEKLFIIGDGRHRKEMENLAKELNVKDKIVFLGFKTEPYAYLKNAKAFVHSSKFEGLPTVLIEALIYGKLIVATDCPTGPKEILNEGKNGILTKLGDEKSLANGLKEILVNKENNEKYLNNSKEYVKNFDSKYVMRELEALL